MKRSSRTGLGRQLHPVFIFAILLLLSVPRLPASLSQSQSDSSVPSQAAETPSANLASQNLVPAPKPLAPGKVSYINTWNQSTKCTIPVVAPSPLASVLTSAQISVQIPKLLLQGKPTGQYINHVYTFSPNGTFIASDDQGNSFGWNSLSGLPAGVTTSALKANTTAAFLSLVTVSSGTVISNITISYKVEYRFCQPAGLKISIHGHTVWGQSSTGVLSLAFSRPPISVSGTTAFFGNKSGVKLGFDWSDSKSLSPVYSSSSKSVSWNVGSSFTIDPVTVATSTGTDATGLSSQQKITYASGRWWLFFSDGAAIKQASSTDGVTFNTPSTVTSTTGASSGNDFSVFVRHSTLYYALSSAGNSATFSWRQGTLNTDGTITWSISETAVSTSSTTRDMSTLTLDASGNLFVAVKTYSSGCGNSLNFHVEVWKDAAGTWSSSLVKSPCDYITGIELVNMTSGIQMSYAYTLSCIFGFDYLPTGGSWSADQSWNSNSGCPFSISSIGNTAYEANLDNSNNYQNKLNFNSWTWGGSASTYKVLENTREAWNPALTASGSTIVVSSEYSGSNVNYTDTTNGGVYFTFDSRITGSETSAQSLTATPTLFGLDAGLAWVSGSASPYNVRFESFPPIAPVAPTSPNSWSRPGLSPFESYFQNLAEYVSPGNGLLSITQTDLSLPGRGINLGIGRTFATPYGFRSNSPYQYDNFTLANLGNGWSLNVPWLGTNYLHLADGQAYPYRWSGNTFQLNNATNFTLVKNVDSSYTLFDPSGTQYSFAANKSLISATDRTGNNIVSFKYSSGHISRIIDSIGRSVTFSYNANNQLGSITSGTRTWSYGYVGNLLVSATDPAGDVTRYEYNNGINRWLITGIIYASLGGVTYSYASAPVGTDVTTYYVNLRNVYSSPMSSSLTESINNYYRIINGLVTWSNATMSDSTNIQGYLSVNFQNSKGLIKSYDKNSAASVVKITEQDFDKAGRINQTKLYSPTNTLLTSSQVSYDNWGNIIYTNNAVGHKTYYSYANTNSQNTFGTSGFSNAFYSPLTISSNIHNALVGVASLQNGTGTAAMELYNKYDSSGNLLETKQLHNAGWLLTDYTYDTYGNQVSMMDANAHTTYTHYSSTYSHAYPTLKSVVVNTVNVTSSRSYDSATGNVLSQTDANGHVTSYAYDSLNRLSTITYPAISGVSPIQTYSYDNTRNIVTLTDPKGNVIKQSYDGLERLNSLQRYNGSTLYSTESYTYNWLNLVASKTPATGAAYSFTYDQDGRPTVTTNPGSSTVTTSYDDVNNIKTVTDEDGHQKQYLYNWAGELMSVREYYKTGAYNTTSYRYDLAGNLIKQTDQNGKITTYQYDDLNRLTRTNYPDTSYESKSYDSVSNLVSRTDPKGNTIGYTYDALNRLTTITYPGTGNTVTYTYDNTGNRLTKIDPGSNDYYTYDALNRVTNETDKISGSRYQVLYTYDQDGNILTTQYPDGSSATFSYDVFNRVSNVNNGLLKFTYTAADQVSTITYGNGVVTSYAYDNRNRPTRILGKQGNNKILDLNYTYDAASNVLTINTETYTYDWLNRVATSAGPWGSISYNYDGTGNIVGITQNSIKTTYGYGNYNRLTSVGSSTLSYDGNGNLQQLVNGTNTWVYSYDYENRLAGVTKNSATVETNTFDSDGKRVLSTQGSLTTTYVYEGANLIYTKNTGSSAINKFFYADGLLLFQACECGLTYYYLDDAQGSVRVIMQGSSNTLFSTNYKPFGLNYQKVGASVFQYTGQVVDSATGLYYLGSRFYNPAIQRFITQDTFPGIAEDPQSLDRYVYTENNPLSHTDPTGHDDTCDPDMGCNPFADQLNGIQTTTATTGVNGYSTGTDSGCSDPEICAQEGLNAFASQDYSPPAAPAPAEVDTGPGCNNPEVCAQQGINVFQAQLDAMPVTPWREPAMTTEVQPTPQPSTTSTTTTTTSVTSSHSAIDNTGANSVSAQTTPLGSSPPQQATSSHAQTDNVGIVTSQGGILSGITSRWQALPPDEQLVAGLIVTTIGVGMVIGGIVGAGAVFAGTAGAGVVTLPAFAEDIAIGSGVTTLGVALTISALDRMHLKW